MYTTRLKIQYAYFSPIRWVSTLYCIRELYIVCTHAVISLLFDISGLHSPAHDVSHVKQGTPLPSV